MKIFLTQGTFYCYCLSCNKSIRKATGLCEKQISDQIKKMFQGHFHRHQHVSVMKLGLNVNILFSKIERSRIRKHGHEQIPVP